MFEKKILRALALMLASVLLLAAAACAPSGEPAASSAEAASKAEASSQSGAASETASQSEAASSETAVSSQESIPDDFTPGTLADGVYTNAWAGFRFTLPADVTAVDEEQLAMYGNENVVFGLMAMNNGGASRMLTVMFEKPTDETMSTVEYLGAIGEQTLSAGGNAGYEMAVSGFFKITIGGKEYDAIRLEVYGGTDDGASLGVRLNGGKLTQYYCLRQEEGIFISVMVADPSEDWIKSTLASFTAA